MMGLFDAVAAWGTAPWIALVIIGYALVVVEMYIPGFGLPGISGLFCLVIGIFFMREPFDLMQFIAFAIVWVGLAFFTYGEFRTTKENRLE